MKMKRIMAAVAAGVMALCCAGCSGSGKKEPLKVGVKSDVIGFGFKDTVTNEYQGLEIELAKKIADELGYDGVEFTAVRRRPERSFSTREVWTAFSRRSPSPTSARRVGTSPLRTSPTR